MSRLAVAAALWCVLFAPASAAFYGDDSIQAHKDAVHSVPGYNGTLRSSHYGGYVTVGRRHGRHLYYYLVEAEAHPTTAPLILWLNGGPGCSSFDGLILEHGPFSVEFVGGKDVEGRHKQPWYLKDNPSSWSHVASVLYVDSPAGVGMSYSETPSDYETDDDRTTRDTAIFVARFLQRHPRFENVPLYIAGESYAGVYVPLLAREILRNRHEGKWAAVASRQLKGYLVGNPVTDLVSDGSSLATFAAGMSLIPSDLHATALLACGNGSISDGPKVRSAACRQELNRIGDLLIGINKYSILEPCYVGGNPYTGKEHETALIRHPGLRMSGSDTSLTITASTKATLQGAEAVLGPAARAIRLGHTPGCLDSREMWAFANDPATREAIHAEPISSIGAFDECTNGDRIRYRTLYDSVLNVHEELLEAGLQVLAYSGDHDAIVSHVGTEAWTSRLGCRILAPWAQWRLDDGTVGGFVVRYDGISYATVLGAGHAVPSSRPIAALTMLRRFVQHGRLDATAVGGVVKGGSATASQ